MKKGDRFLNRRYRRFLRREFDISSYEDLPEDFFHGNYIDEAEKAIGVNRRQIDHRVTRLMRIRTMEYINYNRDYFMLVIL